MIISTFAAYLIFGFGLYSATFSALQSTQNVKSFILFRLIPFVCGSFLAVIGARALGWI